MSLGILRQEHHSSSPWGLGDSQPASFWGAVEELSMVKGLCGMELPHPPEVLEYQAMGEQSWLPLLTYCTTQTLNLTQSVCVMYELAEVLHCVLLGLQGLCLFWMRLPQALCLYLLDCAFISLTAFRAVCPET